MIKQLIFAALALFFLGPVKGSGMENPALLPTLNSVTVKDTVSPVNVISLRNEWADLHQIVIPKPLPLEWDRSGAIIDFHPVSPAYQNIFEMIQGRVPGVWVSGSFNNYKIRIRGAMRPPLVVVDGMPFRSYDDEGVNILLGSISPFDVDYIEILKGIAEAAIYGPGAGNGVIIVRTKTGELLDSPSQ